MAIDFSSRTVMVNAALAVLALTEFADDLADGAYYGLVQQAVQAHADEETAHEYPDHAAQFTLLKAAFPDLVTDEAMDLRDIDRRALRNRCYAEAARIAAEHHCRTRRSRCSSRRIIAGVILHSFTTKGTAHADHASRTQGRTDAVAAAVHA